MEKTKLKTGSISRLPENEFDERHVKVRISMFVDSDVLAAIKAQAKRKGRIGYQTLINQKLREIFLQEETLEDRIARLEKLVLKKKGT